MCLSVLSVSLPRNGPGPLGFEYLRSLCAPRGGSPDPTNEDTYEQAPVSPCRWVPPGISVWYDAFQQPSVDPSPCSEYVESYWVQSTNESYPLGFRPQPSPGPMPGAWPASQGPADVQNAFESRESYLNGYTTIASTSGPFTRTTFSYLLPCRVFD